MKATILAQAPNSIMVGLHHLIKKRGYISVVTKGGKNGLCSIRQKLRDYWYSMILLLL